MAEPSSRTRVECRQLPDESPQDFAVRLQALLPETDEAILIFSFQSGLRSRQCREFVWYRRPDSLACAIRSAQEFSICNKFRENADELGERLTEAGVKEAKEFSDCLRDIARHKFTTIETAEEQVKKRISRRQVLTDSAHDPFNKYLRLQFEIKPIFMDKLLQLRFGHSPLSFYLTLPEWWRRLQKRAPAKLTIPGK